MELLYNFLSIPYSHNMLAFNTLLHFIFFQEMLLKDVNLYFLL